MRKYLLLFLVIGFWSCEDIEEKYTIYDLPQEFPLDKSYAWEYERTFYNTKALWESALQPDTTYLDTLYISLTENDYSYYWWGHSPYAFNLVKNQEDVNHFIRTGRYYLENDSIGFWDKPNLWTNYSSNFDTTGYHSIYYSFFYNRTTAKDTTGDTITNSFLESSNIFYDDYEYFVEKESNLFGTESWKYYYDFINDFEEEDVFGIVKKRRVIDFSSTSALLILSELDNQLKYPNNWHNNSSMPQRYFKDRISYDGIW